MNEVEENIDDINCEKLRFSIEIEMGLNSEICPFTIIFRLALRTFFYRLWNFATPAPKAWLK